MDAMSQPFQYDLDNEGSLLLRCHDFHLLVVDTRLPQGWKNSELLLKLDAVVAVRWTLHTQILITDLLNQLAEVRQSIIPPYPPKLSCIILPRLPNRISGLLWREAVIKSLLQQAWRNRASLVQLEVVRSSKKMMGTPTGVGENRATFSRIHPTPGARSPYLQQYNDGKARLLLFQKFGVGRLEMYPFFHVGSSQRRCSQFDALFIWTPHRSINSSPGRRNMQTTSSQGHQVSLLYSASLPHGLEGNKLQDRGMNSTKLTVEGIASQRVCALVHRLAEERMLMGSPGHLKSQNRQTTFAQLGGRLRQSRTFTSGMSFACSPTEVTSPTNCEAQRFSSRGLDKPPPVTRTKLQESGGAESRSIVTTLPKSALDTGGMETEASVLRENRHVQLVNHIDTYLDWPSETTEDLEMTLNNQGPTQNGAQLKPLSVQPQVQLKHMRKSPSCPTHLTDGQFYPESADPSLPTGPFSSSTPFSATVLLAIPETGESDYFAESPQCLTVQELRELGLYDDDDEDDQDEDEGEEEAGSKEDVAGGPSGESAGCAASHQPRGDRCSQLVDCCVDLDGGQLFNAIRVTAGLSEKSPDPRTGFEPSGHAYGCISAISGELVR